MKIYDFEVYVTDPEEREQLLVWADEAGIEKMVGMPSAKFRPPNRMVAELIAGDDRFIGCCQVNPRFEQEAVAELEMCVTELGMRALKLMPTYHGYAATDRILDPIMEKVQELGIPVNIHSGDYNAMPLQIAALAERYPDVSVIMDHMGYRLHTAEAVLAAEKCPNIYLGTTIATAEPIVIKRAVEAVGAERIVFGSNAPGAIPVLCVEAIKRQDFSEEELELIFWRNLARIYGID